VVRDADIFGEDIPDEARRASEPPSVYSGFAWCALVREEVRF